MHLHADYCVLFGFQTERDPTGIKAAQLILILGIPALKDNPLLRYVNVWY